jgi:hypothetical protein
MQTNNRFTSTLAYNHPNETYSFASGYDLHTRISFRGTVHHHLRNIAGLGNTIPETKEQRYDNYVWRCLEEGIRPYGYSDADWNSYLHEFRLEAHSDRCANAESWRYE